MDQLTRSQSREVYALIETQQSPLRINTEYRISAVPEHAFSLLADLERITRFFPMIYHASVEHSVGGAGEGFMGSGS